MARCLRNTLSARRSLALAGFVFLSSPCALAQTAPAPAPVQTAPPPVAPPPEEGNPTDEADTEAPAPGLAPETTSSAAPEGSESAPGTPSSPAAPQGSEPAPAAASPASTEPDAPAAPAGATQEPVDDYDGASTTALVEEKPRPKNLSLGVAVDLTWPMGKAADFISKTSIQGLSLDLRYYAWGNIGIGLGLGLDSLSKKSTETATWENATITGTQVRELSYTPLTLKGYYAWREQTRVVPYVAAGLGAARAVQRLTVGITGLAEASWHFAIVPEVGLQIPAGPTLLLTNVRLNYLPPSAGVGEHVFANLSFGLSIQ